MPRFFFNIDAADAAPDETGAELADFAAAKDQAVQLLAETLNNRPDLFWDADRYAVTVCDDRGLTLFVLELAAIMAPASPPPSPRTVRRTREAETFRDPAQEARV